MKILPKGLTTANAANSLPQDVFVIKPSSSSMKSAAVAAAIATGTDAEGGQAATDAH